MLRFKQCCISPRDESVNNLSWKILKLHCDLHIIVTRHLGYMVPEYLRLQLRSIIHCNPVTTKYLLNLGHTKINILHDTCANFFIYRNQTELFTQNQ